MGADGVNRPHQSVTETDLWGAFVNAKTSNELCHAWLELVCEQIPDASAAAVLVESQEAQTYVPMAVWPEANPSIGRLATVVEASLRERRGVVLTADKLEENGDFRTPISPANKASPTQLAYPLILGERIAAVVALETTQANANVSKILQELHWSSAWLSNLFAGKELEEALAAKTQVKTVLEVIAVALRQGKLQQVLFEIVNELRQRLACNRAAIGLVTGASVKLTALSEAATIEKNTSLAKAYLRAMEEAYDFGKTTSYDASTDGRKFPMHQELTHVSGAKYALSCPLYEGGQVIGMLTLERSDEGFADHELAWLDALTALLAPVIAQRKKAEQGTLMRLQDEVKTLLNKLFGPRYLVWKLAAASAFIALVVLLIPMDYRVTAKTVIEGEVQRAVSAPFDGFIESALARPGDTVKQGQWLASLDDRELIIEKTRWSSERDQYDNRLREAMATHDLTAVQVLGAQLSQAEAELSLVTKKIEHAHLVAPFDGFVVSGDLSQQIGAPVEVGKKLFEVAPLQSYRVILQIDERDIRHIRAGQSGQLVITGFAGQPMPLTIQKVTPVATAEDGKNFFRVEASLPETSVRLRPGMEGVGKVVTNPMPLWWILFHSFTDWLRLTLWTWMP